MSIKVLCASVDAHAVVYVDWEIGMRESGGPEMAALGDLL